jgi:hypothetical protein
MYQDQNRAHTNNENSPDEDLALEQRSDLKKKLQIFQSESKWEEYDYDDISSADYKIPEGEVGGYEDDEIKSGFHSDLKEQFKKVHVQKGILKNSNPKAPEVKLTAKQMMNEYLKE